MSDVTRRDPEAGERLWAFLNERIADTGMASLAELTRRSGVARGTLYRWRDGWRPEIDAGPRVAVALGTTYEELMRRRSGEPPPREVIQMTPDELADLVARAAAQAVRQIRDDERGRGE